MVWLDSTTVIELNSEDIGAFTISNNDTIYHFERLKNSTDLNFYQALYKNEKGFSLYKLLATKFVKADYQTNGLFESGKKYDEYIDTQEYFILSPKGELTKISFRKKSIQKALENESSKVERFFSQHKNDNVDETLVKNLIESLNTQQ